MPGVEDATKVTSPPLMVPIDPEQTRIITPELLHARSDKRCVRLGKEHTK